MTLEHNLVDLRTGEVEETPLDDRHLETLRVTKRGRASTHGKDVDTGGSTLKSRKGDVSLEDNRTITPRPGVMGRPRPANNGGLPKGRGRRRRDEDAGEDYNGRNEVVITMR